MVREASRRIAKYSAKIVGDVVKNRIDALKDSMVDQVTDQFGLIVEKELLCKSQMNTWGVHSIEAPFYMSYVRKLYGINRRHGSGGTAVEEACIATKAFIDRGLDNYRLMTLASDIYGYDVSACTA